MRLHLVLAVLVLALPHLGCAAGDPPPDGADAAFELCPTSRPQACTKEYRPACGHRCAEPPCPRDQRHTYGNACDACAHAAVVAVTPGPCDGGGPSEAPTLR